MTSKNLKHLNQLFVSAPNETLITSEWLEKHGISSKLAWWYVHSGLLERVGMKAYKKVGADISWPGVISALQEQLGLRVHVGGKSALQLTGTAHFLPMHGLNELSLFVNLHTRLPSWFSSLKLENVKFGVFHTSLIDDPLHELGLINKKIDGIAIQIASPERAALELLYLFPKHYTATEIMQLFENFGQFRPKVIQELLEKCTSIKVVRLFLYLSEKFNHVWFSSLNHEKFNLGKGKRVIGQGGKYNHKYKLSVPKEMSEE